MNQLFKNLLICLSFVVLANASNLKKEPKLPKVQVETVRLIQPPKRSTSLDSSFMPVFLTSNVKASDFTQEMLKSLASNNFIKPSVKKLSSINKSNSSNKENLNVKKVDKQIKSSTVGSESNRWFKAGTTSSNFSPVLPINLSKMTFDTTGFIPIIPKQATRSSSNAKLSKQASKPIRPNVSAKTIVLTKPAQIVSSKQQMPKNSSSGSKRTNKQIADLNKLIQKNKNVLPNPSIRPLKSIKSNIKLSNLKQTTFKPIAKSTTSTTLTTTKPTNAKIIDNRPIAAASSTELNSYLNSQLNSHDARKALLKMNTLRYLAKLSPHWSASSLSETYQTKVGNGPLKAYPISKITIPSDGSYDSGYGSNNKKPDVSIDLIKEILHKLTHDEVQFNKLYVMGTHRYKGQSNDQQYQNNQPEGGSSDGGYQPENNDQYQSGYQQNDGGNSYQDSGSSGYSQDEGGYNQPENGGEYNQPDNQGYSQPDYSQPDNYDNGNNGNQYGPNENGGYSNGDSNDGGNSYSNEGNGYANEGGNGYSNDGGNTYGSNDGGNSYSNEGGNSYGSNDGGNGGNGYSNDGGNSYNSNEGNGNSYQNGDSDQEQGYHLQSLGYDMSNYDNRAYVPAYSLHSLASFVHSKFKETAMKKQQGEYQYMDNPYVNNYDNYKSMDVNYAQYVPDQMTNMMGGGRKKKCSKHQNNGGDSGYESNNNNVNSDVKFDDSYNNYGMPQMQPHIWYNNNNG